MTDNITLDSAMPVTNLVDPATGSPLTAEDLKPSCHAAMCPRNHKKRGGPIGHKKILDGSYTKSSMYQRKAELQWLKAREQVMELILSNLKIAQASGDVGDIGKLLD